MLNKYDLMKEVGSLDMLISAVSYDLAEQQKGSASPSELLTEMEEALCELRKARGFRKVLLTVLDNRGSAATRKSGRKAVGIKKDVSRVPLSGGKVRVSSVH